MKRNESELVRLTMSRQRAHELGLLVCACGHPHNNHIDHGKHPCAHCGCTEYREQGLSRTTLSGLPVTP